jgi:hypothetical protein
VEIRVGRYLLNSETLEMRSFSIEDTITFSDSVKLSFLVIIQ